MKLYKGTILISVISLVIFCTITFVIPFTRSTAFWISYVFALIAIFVLIITAAVCNSAGKSLQSRFYGWQTMTISTAYFFFQLIASIIFMAFPAIPTWVVITVCMLLLGINLIGIVFTNLDNDAILREDNNIRSKVEFIRTLDSIVAETCSYCKDVAIASKLQILREKICYSDPISHPSLLQLETKIKAECELLLACIMDNRQNDAIESYERIINMLDKRNRDCRNLK